MLVAANNLWGLSNKFLDNFFDGRVIIFYSTNKQHIWSSTCCTYLITPFIVDISYWLAFLLILIVGTLFLLLWFLMEIYDRIEDTTLSSRQVERSQWSQKKSEKEVSWFRRRTCSNYAPQGWPQCFANKSTIKGCIFCIRSGHLKVQRIWVALDLETCMWSLLTTNPSYWNWRTGIQNWCGRSIGRQSDTPIQMKYMSAREEITYSAIGWCHWSQWCEYWETHSSPCINHDKQSEFH